MKKRIFARTAMALTALAFIMNFAAISASAEYLDPTSYMNKNEYKVTFSGDRHPDKESMITGSDTTVEASVKIQSIDESNHTELIANQKNLVHVPQFSDMFWEGLRIDKVDRYTDDPRDADDPDRDSHYNEETRKNWFWIDYEYERDVDSFWTVTNLEAKIKLNSISCALCCTEYTDRNKTIEDYINSIPIYGTKNVEEHGNVYIVSDVQEKIGFNNNGIEQEVTEQIGRVQKGVTYVREIREKSVYMHYIYTLPELPYYFFTITYSFSDNFSSLIPSDTSKIGTDYYTYLEEYNKIRQKVMSTLEDLKNASIRVDFGEIEYPKQITETDNEETNKEGTHIVVDTDAAPLPDDAKKDDTPGRKTNETSTDIPAVIFVSTAGVAAAAGAAGASGKNKKDNKKKSTFRLAINKQFGDTIRMQGKPEFVYARIIEVTPEGHEFTREDLSEKIRIYAGSAGINVEETGMIGGYKSARVFAPKSDEVECIVSFRFEYEGNSYTNNVRFWLEEPGILFYQENLALPAKYDKEAELPFTVTGFEPDKATVELRMSEGAPYHVQLVESENDPSTHWAVLTDICDKDQDAGTMLDCYLIVSVTDGEVTIEEQFPVTRVGLGLNFAMPALNCFRIPKKSAEGKRWDELTYSDFEAATTTARVVLILFDEEQQRIIQMPADPTFELTPIVNDDISKERIDGLGLKTRLTKVESGYSEVTFFCEKGWLEPPVRLFMNIKATWKYGEGDKKETYVCEKKVLMRSQPLREYKNENMRTAAYKTDKERFELLDRMTDMILHNNWFDELEELYARAFLMMKYYDHIYGYDDLQFEQIHGAFMSYLGYRQAKLEYAAAKDNYQADKKNDDLLHEIAFRAGAMNSSWTGIISRIALGIGTAGGSEIFLTPLDIINSGVEYQMENLPEEQTTWGKLWAGVKAPVISLGIGYAFKLGGWAGGKLVNAGKAAYRATAKAVPKIAKYTADKVSKSALLPKSLKNGIQKASKYFDELAESVPECDPKGLKGSASAAQEAMEQAVLRGEASADDIIKSLSGDLTQLEKLQVAAVEAGNKEGAELLNGLKAAIDNYRLSGKSPMTEGALRENIVKMCRNKFAIEQMIAENPGQADIYRKLFTKYRAQFFYEPVKNESRKHIAEMLGCSIDDIQIKSVSGNTSTALENGVTIGHDLDVTFIYKSKDGKTLIELPQAIAEDALYKTGCKKAGLNFSSMKEAKELAESLQLHACQPSDGERLPEVQKIIDKYFRTSQLSAESVTKFKNAEIYKTVPMYNEAMEALRKVAPSEPEAAALAKKLADYTSGKGTLDAACKTAINSVGNMRDTFRAAVKGGNLVKGKAVGALTVSGESGLNSRYHTIMSICDKARKGKITIPEANKSLAKMGFNVETALNEAFGMIGEVNKRLGAGSSGAVAEGVSNAARSAASASAGSYTQD